MKTEASAPRTMGIEVSAGVDPLPAQGGPRRSAGRDSRVLAIERQEFCVQRRFVFADLEWAVEEHLGGHGEELSRVRPRVWAQHGRTLGAHRVVGPRADLDPADPGRLVAERRRTVGDAVQHVELMGELVVHHVLAAGRETSSPPCCCPRQHDRTPIVGLAGEGLRARAPQPTADGVVAVEAHCRRMHDHGAHLRVVVDLEAEEQHRRLGRDQHADVVGQVESVGGFPPCPMNERSDQCLQTMLLARVEHPPMLEVGSSTDRQLGSNGEPCGETA